MAFFNQLQRGVDVAKFKANQLSRINKLQNDIANIVGEIQSIRKQIADTTIQLHRSNIDLPPQLVEFCKEIAKLENNITGIEQSINAIRAETYSPNNSVSPTPSTNLLKCPHCAMEIPDGAEFCIHCGKKTQTLME